MAKDFFDKLMDSRVLKAGLAYATAREYRKAAIEKTEKHIKLNEDYDDEEDEYEDDEVDEDDGEAIKKGRKQKSKLAKDGDPNSIIKINERKNKSLSLLLLVAALTGLEGLLLCSIKLYSLGIPLIIITIFGLLLIIKFLKRNKRYEKYIQLIIVQNERDLLKISKDLNSDINMVNADVVEMISNGIFKDCYIDKRKHKILFSSNPKTITKLAGSNAKIKIVKCSSCGAKVTLDDKSNICKYCGSVIE